MCNWSLPKGASPLVVLGLLCAALVPGAAPCEDLAVYQVSLTTKWSPQLFPKHYPDWRPPATFSRLVGECSMQARGSGSVLSSIAPVPEETI